MEDDVLFKTGTQEEYNVITPDEHTLYRVEHDDIYDVYLGDTRLSNGNANDFVFSLTYDTDTKTLNFSSSGKS